MVLDTDNNLLQKAQTIADEVSEMTCSFHFYSFNSQVQLSFAWQENSQVPREHMIHIAIYADKLLIANKQ